jgi:uncharacterized iron-regulated membrane protein
MKFHWHKWTRKAHRYLGVLIGIQFMAWTAGGLYFSWVDLEKIHGSDLIGPAPVLAESIKTAPLDGIVEDLLSQDVSAIHRIDFLTISESAATYRISHTDTEGERGATLIDAVTGHVRGHLTEEESSILATARYAGTGKLIETRLIEATGPHDEYRELPLPAYAFTFDDDRRTTFYVAPAHSRITAVRNGNWRIFDFLWMLHTMDYEGRDDFNNLLLQAFAVFGLLTLLSGFALFLFSSKVFRNASRRRTS